MFRILLPLSPLLVLSLLLALPQQPTLPAALSASLSWLPVVLGLSTLLLSKYFHNTRLGQGAVLLLLLQYLLIHPFLTFEPRDFLAPALIMLISLHAVSKERMMFSPYGNLRLLLLLCVVLTAYLLHGGLTPPSWAGFLEPVLSSLRQSVTGFSHYAVPAMFTLLGLGLLIALLLLDFTALILLLGSFCLWYKPEFLWFSAVQLSLLITLLVNAYAMAFVDQLTGIPGRRAFDACVNNQGRHYCIAMMDVDHFKKFNDTYGHDVGDQVLKLVAKKIAGVRGGGQAFRYGGEEFSVVFSGEYTTQVMEALEEVREAIAEYPMRIRSADRPKKSSDGRQGRGKKTTSNEVVHVTISIGVAERTKEIRLPAQVLKAADQALYKAKKAGRNKVISVC